MTEVEKQDLATWLKERAEQLAERRRIGEEEYEERKAKYGEEYHRKMGMEAYYRSRMACRADCGEQNPKLYCSKCKIARYCDAACQAEDWKYHKTYCGEEKPIPKEYR